MGFLLEYKGGSFLSLRSLPWRRRILVSDARTDCAVSPIQARHDVHGRFAPFRVCRALLAFGSESASEDRHANKCGAPRIRRRSRTHLAES